MLSHAQLPEQDLNAGQFDEEDAPFRARLERALGDQYQLQGEIGRGGMGIVYRATDQRLRRTVAIKVLPPELAFRAETRSRFLREAIAAAQLSHPNIVPIFSVDERDGLVWFAMGFVDGESLAALIAREGTLPHQRVRAILGEVADALGYAHARGVVHRDIKPDNIIIDRHNQRPVVTDFGIARAVSDSDATRLTATGVAIGTPAYMSPEQCAGELDIDGRSDLYSLGIVGYQLLSGAPPFVAPNTPALLMKHFSEPPRDIRAVRPSVPADLAQVVMRLLEKKPADRFATGGELEAALAGGPLPPPPVPRAREVEARPERLDHLGEIEPRRTHRTARRERQKEKHERFRDKPLAERVRLTRTETFRSAGLIAFLWMINIFTSPFIWAIFPTLGIGLGVWGKISSLLSDGVSFAEIFGERGRQLAANAGKAALPVFADPSRNADPALRPATHADAGAGRDIRQAPALAAADPDEKFAPREVLAGPFGATVRQAIADLKGINAQIDKLSKEELALVPELPATARGLFDRVVSLSSSLANLDRDVDAAKIEALAKRVAEAEAAGGGDGAAEVDRRLVLLRKQQETFRKLSESRHQIANGLESASLMLQNLALDVLRLRSAGVRNAMNDVNSVTTEARALMREIGHVVGAADEVRALSSASKGDKI